MKCIAVVLALGCVLAAADAMALPYMLNMSGNNFSMTEPAQTGSQLRIAAQLSRVQDNPPVTLPGITNWSTEYTVYITGLTLQSDPNAFQRNFSGGTLEIWAHSSPNSPWTPTTPVASIPSFNPSDVPGTFTDGSKVLKGNFTSFTILDFTQFGSSEMAITGTNLNFFEGAYLVELEGLGIRNGWSWNGWIRPDAPVPGGYQNLYGGKVEIEEPTPVEPATWGQIKNTFK